ncbi:ABC transporter ATP-binding protein/permease [Corynebacterium sp. LD5P10]|uniref:Fatty acid ABC transporter ATP-binding/permease protein n=2 Tax=Corynebacterium kalidii TaxID=2931982 RepID=A0A9X1WFC9_9CORY|nr:ABC transporter ATP-binding protein/permease [Corynebacterium kalidii]
MTETPEVADRGDESAPRSAKAFWPSALRMVALMAPRKIALTWVFVLLVVCVVLTVYAPKVLGDAVDVIYDGVLSVWNDEPGAGIDFTELGRLIGIVLGMYLVAGVFNWAQGFILNRIVVAVVVELRTDVERKVHRLPLSYYDSRQTGDLLSRTTNDVDNVQQALQQALSQFAYSGMMIIGVTVMMFRVSWQLAVVALLALPLTAVVVGIVGTRAQKQYGAQWANTGKVNGHVEESFTGHDLVVAYGRQGEMAVTYDERNEELYEASAKAQFLSGMMMPLMQFLNYLSYVVIAVFGGLRVANGQMSLGAATAFIQYSREFNQPLGELAGMMTMVQSGVASAERVFELLDAEEQDPDPETPVSSTELVAPVAAARRGRVEFRDVSFGYSPQAPLIEHLDLEVDPGQTIAIVGPTGAGKTTMVNLVMRFYEVTSGAILVDGVDTRTMGRAELRSRTGMVLQDAVLFDGTILENIRYGRLDATDDEVVAAAKAAYVDRFVHALPQGYDTVIDQDGGSVSAGERQLITIARAFLAEPEILILDEATSSVDTRTEVLVQKAMNAIRAQRTSFVIAHRLSTIRDADRILVMVDGSIVEQGSHDALLEADGAYTELYRSQFAAGGAV